MEQITISKDVWTFVECSRPQAERVTVGLLSKGRRLANDFGGQLCTCLIGSHLGEYIEPLSHLGCEKVFLVENELLSEYSVDAYTFILETLINKHHPALILFAAAPLTRELAPRIAARLTLPCVTEARDITANGREIAITKSGYNDKVDMTFDFLPRRTVVVTILADNADVEAAIESRGMEMVREDIDIQPGIIRTKKMGFIKGDPKEVSLVDAEIILAVGKGTDRNSFAVVEELADLLGASIGGTRPVVDDGIIPFERQIGITGKTVAPNLLIACGISGAREFSAGTEKTSLTIAINRDRKARIFKAADLGVVGDLQEILPLIIDRVKRQKQRTEKGRG